MKLTGRCRIYILFLSGVILVLCIVAAIYNALYTEHGLQETKIAEYDLIADNSHQVKTRKNEYVTPEYCSRQGKYIHALVEEIRVEPGVLFQSDIPVNIEGKYEIFIRDYTYQNSGNGEEKLWDNVNRYGEEVHFKKKTNSYKAGGPVVITLSEYEEKILRAKNDLGLGMSGTVEIYIEGEIEVNYKDYSEKIPIYSGISIPLNMSRFEISELKGETEHKEILKKIEFRKRRGLSGAFPFIIPIPFAVTAMLFIIFGVKEMTPAEVRIAKIRRLVRANRGRLIRLVKMPDVFIVENYQVASLTELMRMSEEMGKPVFYVEDELEIVYGGEIFMVDGSNKYTYRLSEVD